MLNSAAIVTFARGGTRAQQPRQTPQAPFAHAADIWHAAPKQAGVPRAYDISAGDFSDYLPQYGLAVKTDTGRFTIRVAGAELSQTFAIKPGEPLCDIIKGPDTQRLHQALHRGVTLPAVINVHFCIADDAQSSVAHLRCYPLRGGYGQIDRLFFCFAATASLRDAALNILDITLTKIPRPAPRGILEIRDDPHTAARVSTGASRRSSSSATKKANSRA